MGTAPYLHTGPSHCLSVHFKDVSGVTRPILMARLCTSFMVVPTFAISRRSSTGRTSGDSCIAAWCKHHVAMQDFGCTPCGLQAIGSLEIDFRLPAGQAAGLCIDLILPTERWL